MEKKGEMTADFLKEEEKMRKSDAMEDRKMSPYDENNVSLEEKIRRATPKWRGVDSEEFIDFVRRGVGMPKWVRLSDSTDPMPIIE